MHLMLQQPFPDDFVIATGKTQSVKVLCELAFGEAGLDYRDYVKLDQAVYRPAEVDLLIGDASKASSVLQWQPSVDFVGLIQEMVQADMRAIASLLKAEPVLHSS
jgi:GDPmannose 4,6-dehydratase